MGVNSLPRTVTRQRRDCDLNPGPSAPESNTLTTRLPSHPTSVVKSTSTIAILLLLSQSWYSFHRPAESGRLSRSRHCSMCVQPVPKAAYCSGRHGRPRQDSNSSPVTRQSDAITNRPLRPARIRLEWDLVVVGTVGGLFDAGVSLLISHLHADHRVHIDTGQLTGFYHRHRHLHSK